MESKKIESIFEDYLNKEKTNYALLISGKWGSGKTYLWKNVLEKKASEKNFKPVYVSLNGINNSNEIESILFSKVMFADKLDNPIINNSLKFFRNGANILGSVFAGGSKLEDLTKGMKLNIDLSNIVICFDDLERSQMPVKEVLGLINDYTEHKNLKVVICAYETEIEDKEYNKLKEKIIGRILNYTANYDELMDSYTSKLSVKKFSDFLNVKRKIIIDFFRKHDIQNLRTFGFYLENLNLLFKYYENESESDIDRMLFFAAIISNEFKNGELTIANLKNKNGIDDFMIYVDFDDVDVDVGMGTPIFKSKEKEDKPEKLTYKKKFINKYLSNQNEKDLYLFSGAIYEFVLSGYLDVNKLKNEIDTRNGKNNNTKEEKAYNTLMGYNFRMLENEELDKSIKEVLKYAEQGKYNMYNYQTIFNNLSFYIKIGALEIEEKKLAVRLINGLGISKNISDIDFRQMHHINIYKQDNGFNDVEKKIFELHNEKVKNKKSAKANEIFDVLDKDLVEVDDFFNKVLSSENSLFEFIDPNTFFNKLIKLKNKNALVLSNCLFDIYKKHFFEFPEKELPFFETLKELITNYSNQNDLLNPQKIILEELLVRINEIIKRFNEAIERKNN